MKTPTKVVLVFLGGIAILVVVALFLLGRNLDGIVRSAIEKYGSQATGTAVRVQQVEIGLREGRGSVQGVSVANPPDFANEPIFRLGDIAIDLDTGTLTSEVPVVESIRIAKPQFYVQVNAQGKTNLEAIKKNLQQFSAAHGGAAKQPSGEKAPPRLRVQRLSIEGGSGILDLTALGGKRTEATLPPITLTDLGGKDGITPAALGEAVVAALLRNLEKVAAKQGIQAAIGGRVQEKAGELQEKLDEKLGPGASEALKGIFRK